MQNEIFFSIIVPIYNAEKCIGRCVKSVLAQSFFDFELLLIDDGSKDESGKICDEIKKHDSRIQVIHKENAGVSAARNLGISISKGKYIGFVDADDTINADCLQRAFETLQEYPFDCLCFGVTNLYQKEDSTYMEVKDTHQRLQMYNQEAIKKEIIKLFPDMAIASVCNKLYARKLLQNHSLVEMKTGEDFVFNMEIMKSCDSYAVLEECFYNYFHNYGERTRSNSFSIEYISDIEKMYRSALELLDYWKIEDESFYLTVNNIMYGIFRKVLCALSKKEYKQAIKNEYVRKAINRSTSYSIKEVFYKKGLLLKGMI